MDIFLNDGQFCIFFLETGKRYRPNSYQFREKQYKTVRHLKKYLPKRTLEQERCFRYSGGRKIIVPNLRHFFYFFKIIVFFWPTKDWPILRLMTIL